MGSGIWDLGSGIWGGLPFLKFLKFFKSFLMVFLVQSIKNMTFGSCFGVIPYGNPLEFESPTTEIEKGLGGPF